MTECVNCAKFKGCDLSSPNVNECADYKEILTNEEWFDGLSTEEKARFLACEFTVACDDYAYSNNKGTWNEKYWLEWLKEIHQ